MLNITLLYNTNGDSVSSVCEEGCDSFGAVARAKSTEGSAAVVYLQRSVSIISVSDAQVICYYQT